MQGSEARQGKTGLTGKVRQIKGHRQGSQARHTGKARQGNAHRQDKAR
jgi:hypothetical protein